MSFFQKFCSYLHSKNVLFWLYGSTLEEWYSRKVLDNTYHISIKREDKKKINGDFEIIDKGDSLVLSSDEDKQYIRYITDRRLILLGLKPNFGIKDNPLPWVSEIISGVDHSNFFETRVTEYSVASLEGDDWGY